VATPFLLGGLLPLDEPARERWGWTGAWQFPVGAPYDVYATEDARTPPFKLLRGVAREAARDSAPGRGHQGADLGNGRAGAIVRAAGPGLVIHVANSGENRGYGSLVVLAHRTREGLLLYSVYAHLRPGSVKVTTGEQVGMGQALGRVGHSGRASTNHLHFEVRRAGPPGERWEHAHPVDPVLFVRRRLPAARDDTTWSAPYVIWAEGTGLLDREARGGQALEHGVWNAMLARAGRHRLSALPGAPGSLRDSLIRVGLLPADEKSPPHEVLSWREFERDLAHLSDMGLRVPPISAPTTGLRALCKERLGTATPGHESSDKAPRGRDRPTLGDACLALATLGARAHDDDEDFPPRP
jgi:Peptidase family M23